MDQVISDNLIEAIDDLIVTFNIILKGLDAQEAEMNSFDTGKTLVKVVGTAANITGAALAVGGAFFTFGASAILGGLIATAGGTATNLITDRADRDKSFECLNHIQFWLQQYKDKADLVKKLSDKFNSMVQDIMRVHNVSFEKAIVLGFGITPLELQGIQVIASAVSTIQFTTSQVRLLETLFTTCFGVTKTAAMAAKSSGIAASTVNAATKTVASAVAKGAAVVNVIFVSVEVINLAIDIFKSHPTVQKIIEIRKGLKKEMSKVQKTSQELKSMQKIAIALKLPIFLAIHRSKLIRRPRDPHDSEDEDDDDERVKIVHFDVTQDDLKQGPYITPYVRAYIASIGKPGDDAGHLKAQMLNGSGSDTENFIPQNASLNRGPFRAHDTKIRDILRGNPKTHAKVIIELYYKIKSTYPNRPVRIVRSFKVFDEEGKVIAIEPSVCYIN